MPQSTIPGPRTIAGDEFGPFDHPFKALRIAAANHNIAWDAVVDAALGDPHAPNRTSTSFWFSQAPIRRVAEIVNLVAYQVPSGYWMAVSTSVPELRRVLLGEAVVMTTRLFDELCPYFHSGIASMHNPRRVGTLDAWVVGTTAALAAEFPEAYRTAREKMGLEPVIPAPHWRRVQELEFILVRRPFSVVAGQGLFVNGVLRPNVRLDEKLTQNHCEAASTSFNDRFAQLVLHIEHEHGKVTRTAYDALIERFIEQQIRETHALSFGTTDFATLD